MINGFLNKMVGSHFLDFLGFTRSAGTILGTTGFQPYSSPYRTGRSLASVQSPTSAFRIQDVY